MGQAQNQKHKRRKGGERGGDSTQSKWWTVDHKHHKWQIPGNKENIKHIFKINYQFKMLLNFENKDCFITILIL